MNGLFAVEVNGVIGKTTSYSKALKAFQDILIKESPKTLRI